MTFHDACCGYYDPWHPKLGTPCRGCPHRRYPAPIEEPAGVPDEAVVEVTRNEDGPSRVFNSGEWHTLKGTWKPPRSSAQRINDGFARIDDIANRTLARIDEIADHTLAQDERGRTQRERVNHLSHALTLLDIDIGKLRVRTDTLKYAGIGLLALNIATLLMVVGE